MKKYRPVRKTDDAPMRFVIEYYYGNYKFNTKDEAEKWADNNLSGTYEIICKTWCEKCYQFTESVYDEGKWITDCSLCDAKYLQARQSELKKLAKWETA